MNDLKTGATELFAKISPEMQDEIIALMKTMLTQNVKILKGESNGTEA